MTRGRCCLSQVTLGEGFPGAWHSKAVLWPLKVTLCVCVRLSKSGASVVVWCGALWCGVVRCGVVWCGVVWCGVVWCGGYYGLGGSGDGQNHCHNQPSTSPSSPSTQLLNPSSPQSKPITTIIIIIIIIIIITIIITSSSSSSSPSSSHHHHHHHHHHYLSNLSPAPAPTQNIENGVVGGCSKHVGGCAHVSALIGSLCVHYEEAVWCSVVWCGVVWCGVVWCSVVWLVWCNVAWLV